MNSLEANIRENSTKGQLNALRNNGNVPAIIYGGKDQNQKISISKKSLKMLIEKENFLSNIITLNIAGKPQNVLPREVKYHILSDEPTHVDFLRVLPGVKIKIEVPVNFINHEKSPGLKRGGVLNIVRRKVELKCPAENIPNEIIVDLAGTDIGTSIKISSVKLEKDVSPTITDRDFVIATVASPTIIKEPEKPAEGEAAAEGAEGEVPAEGAEAAAKEGEAAKKDDKSKESADKKPEEKNKKIEDQIIKKPVKKKTKQKKNISSGIAFVNSTFNNTIISIADEQGNVIAWSSAGSKGFKGSRKSTPYAAQVAADDAGGKAYEQGLRTLSVQVKGPGSGRETALRALQSRGFKIISIKDTTPMPHNGARPPKKRRV